MTFRTADRRPPAWYSVLVEGLDPSITTIDFHDDIIPDIHDRSNGLFGEERARKGQHKTRPGRIRLRRSRPAQGLDELGSLAARLDAAARLEIGLSLPMSMNDPDTAQHNRDCNPKRQHAAKSSNHHRAK